jgi:hypothetical protein
MLSAVLLLSVCTGRAKALASEVTPMFISNKNSTNKQDEFIYFPEAVGTRYFTESFFFYLGSMAPASNWLDDLILAVSNFVKRTGDFARDFNELSAAYAEGR